MSKKPKESPKLQELGPKKYYQKLEKMNKFYDQHMAGKRDPKTGIFYNKIDYSNPDKSKNLGGRPLVSFECLSGCGSVISINTTTVCIICDRCKTLHSIHFDRLNSEYVKIEASSIDKTLEIGNKKDE